MRERILCVGPEGSGKTLLLRRVLVTGPPCPEFLTNTVPTVGVNLCTLPPEPDLPSLEIRELGGSMAQIWHSYYQNVTKLLYVMDASDMTSLGSSTLLLLKLLIHPHLQSTKIALVFNKIDCPLPRNTKELLGVMRFDDLKEFARQEFDVFEVSALSNKGMRNLIKWIKGEQVPPLK